MFRLWREGGMWRGCVTGATIWHPRLIRVLRYCLRAAASAPTQRPEEGTSDV